MEAYRLIRNTGRISPAPLPPIQARNPLKQQGVSDEPVPAREPLPISPQPNPLPSGTRLQPSRREIAGRTKARPPLRGVC